jgi:hypothetical protein
MAQVKAYANASCLKCGAVEKEMVSIGPMIFCPACSDQEFGKITKAEMGQFLKEPLCYWVDPHSSTYSKWLNKYSQENS